MEEVSFEYEVINEGTGDKSSRNMIINVSVISKRVISDYAEILDQAELYPLSFEVESKMISTSVIAKGDMRNYIVINIKDDTTVFIAVIDGVARITSSVSIGESTIRERLLETGLFSDELVSGDFFSSDFPFESTYTQESYTSLINVFSILKDELEKFNEYIINKYTNAKLSPDKKIEKIILCGRSATLPGLAKHINQRINAEILLANAWTNVFDIKDVPPSMKFHDSLNFVTPIGLVISSYKELNA